MDIRKTDAFIIELVVSFMIMYDYDMLSPGQSHLYQPDSNHDINDLFLIKFADIVLLIKSKEF